MQIKIISPYEYEKRYRRILRLIKALLKQSPGAAAEYRKNVRKRLIMAVGMYNPELIGVAFLVQNGDAIHYTGVGGVDLPKGWYIELDRWVTDMAIQNKKRRITSGYRKAWARLLPPLGYVEDGKLLVKEV